MESFHRLFCPSEFLGTPTPFPLNVTNWFSANVITAITIQWYAKKKEERERERSFHFIAKISYSFTDWKDDINYNSKHVSPLFQGFLNDHLKRDCKLEESTEFEDERVRKQWTERLIIPKAWLPVSPIASFVARSTHKQPFLPGREKPRNNIHEYIDHEIQQSRITQLILFTKYSRKILHDFFIFPYFCNKE